MPAPAFIGLALVFVAAATAWVAAATAWAPAAPAWAGPAGDRLERFQEIAVARLSVVEDTGGPLDPASQAEMDALLDGEVLDSLQVGGPFASVAFIRERLHAFAEAWGGASLRIDPLGGGLLAGRFRLSAKGVSNSVRLYGSAKGMPALLRAWQEDGLPEVYPWAVPPGVGAEVLVVWSGTATGWEAGRSGSSSGAFETGSPPRCGGAASAIRKGSGSRRSTSSRAVSTFATRSVTRAGSAAAKSRPSRGTVTMRIRAGASRS